MIVAPGFGVGGQRVYMDVADRFASSGHLVFAYDPTGVDESEGESTVGFPQGVIDLEHAIDFVARDREVGGLPVVPFGHSWGAWCAGVRPPAHRRAGGHPDAIRARQWFRQVGRLCD
ncbi:MAG: lysophospholipase [Atopobiaceae bacterium]|nr:lysophospholipase [Atopobiaceae bacterium]